MDARWLIPTLASWLVVAAGLAQAEVQAITAAHTYVLGDNDSRNDARQLCFLEAKRKVLEKAGSYIQSHSEVTNFKLSKDQITSYSAAVLSVEIVKEDFAFSNGHNNLTLTVKADVDIVDVRQRLQALAEDKGLQDKIATQRDQIRKLEDQVRQLNERLNLAPASSVGELRKERNLVFREIREIENKKLEAMRRIEGEIDKIKVNTERIMKYIVRMMTKEEVKGILGSPIREEASGHYWFYGELWVCFSEPLAQGDYRVYAIGREESVPTRFGNFVIHEKKLCEPNLLSQ